MGGGGEGARIDEEVQALECGSCESALFRRGFGRADASFFDAQGTCLDDATIVGRKLVQFDLITVSRATSFSLSFKARELSKPTPLSSYHAKPTSTVVCDHLTCRTSRRRASSSSPLPPSQRHQTRSRRSLEGQMEPPLHRDRRRQPLRRQKLSGASSFLRLFSRRSSLTLVFFCRTRPSSNPTPSHLYASESNGRGRQAKKAAQYRLAGRAKRTSSSYWTLRTPLPASSTQSRSGISRTSCACWERRRTSS